MWKPRTAKVTLYQGDYQQRIQDAGLAAEAAERRLAAAREDEKRQPASLMLDDEPPSVALAVEFEARAKEHDDLVSEAEAEGAVVVTEQALPALEWDALVEANPPRTGDDVPEAVRESDASLGVNDKALSAALVPLSIVGIQSTDGVTVEDLLAGASSAQWDLLYGTAFALNRTLGADPKASPRLRPSPSTPETAN